MCLYSVNNITASSISSTAADSLITPRVSSFADFRTQINSNQIPGKYPFHLNRERRFSDSWFQCFSKPSVDPVLSFCGPGRGLLLRRSTLHPVSMTYASTPPHLRGDEDPESEFVLTPMSGSASISTAHVHHNRWEPMEVVSGRTISISYNIVLLLFYCGVCVLINISSTDYCSESVINHILKLVHASGMFLSSCVDMADALRSVELQLKSRLDYNE